MRVQVCVSRDGRWRVEIRDNGLVCAYLHGALVKSSRVLTEVTDWLASQGVTPEDLVQV